MAALLLFAVMQFLPLEFLSADPVDGTLPTGRLEKQGLKTCLSDSPSRLNFSGSPGAIILVHGANGSPEGFRSLAMAIRSRGNIALCFSYNDRGDLNKAASQLSSAILSLAATVPGIRIVVIGHSLGGLVARKSLVMADTSPATLNARLHLVTIATPFSGIRRARPCGLVALRVASLGLQDLACWLISGNKWHQITDASSFIREPGQLHPAVQSFILIRTDERNSCRRIDSQRRCLQDDYVFSLEEQRLPPVHGGVQAQRLTLKAGHVAVVGEMGQYPAALLGVLDKTGLSGEERLAMRGTLPFERDRSL